MSRTITIEEAADRLTEARSAVIAAKAAPPRVLATSTTTGGTVGEELAKAATAINRVLETLAKLQAGAPK